MMPLSFRGSTASNLIILTYLIIVFAEMLYLEHIFSEKVNELHLNKILRYRIRDRFDRLSLKFL